MAYTQLSWSASREKVVQACLPWKLNSLPPRVAWLGLLWPHLADHTSIQQMGQVQKRHRCKWVQLSQGHAKPEIRVPNAIHKNIDPLSCQNTAHTPQISAVSLPQALFSHVNTVHVCKMNHLSTVEGWKWSKKHQQSSATRALPRARVKRRGEDGAQSPDAPKIRLPRGAKDYGLGWASNTSR